MFRTLSLVLTLSAVGAMPAAAEWVYVTTANFDNIRMYVDTDSIQRDGRYVWFKQRNIYPVLDREGITQTNKLISMDCQTGIMRTRTLVDFNSAGQVVDRQVFGDRGPLTKVQPGTPAVDIQQAVCQELTSQK